MSPSLLPYYLIFWPGALPSTFDLPKHQEAKYLASVSARVDGLLQGLSVLFMLYANRMNPAPLSSVHLIPLSSVNLVPLSYVN
jgi:hypothetical protein